MTLFGDVERLLEEIEKYPDIKNVKVPEELREDVFKSIREYEAYKAGCERFLEFLHISDEEFEKMIKDLVEKND